MAEALPEYLRAAQAPKIADDAKLARGAQMARELADLDAEIEQTEAHLRSLKDRRTDLARKELPAYFESELHTDSIGIPGANADLKIVPYFHANIRAEWPPEQRAAAFNYLIERDLGDIIGVVVSCTFQRGELREATELADLIRKSKYGNTHPPHMEMGVPWNTLTKVVREEIEAGRSVDTEILGATIAREAKIVKRKAK